MSRTNTFPETIEEFTRLQIHLHALIDDDPQAAISEARMLGESLFFSVLKAGTLVDGGAAAKDVLAISEGITIFRKQLDRHSTNSLNHYNLANGLIALADATPYCGVDWYLTTAELRREARGHFVQAGALSDDTDIAARAYANVGNTFWRSHRWSEAYDAYKKALEHDSTNGVALTGAVKVLLSLVEKSAGDSDILLEVAARHLKAANDNHHRISELAGQRALESLLPFLEQELRGGMMPDLSNATPYEKFVARNRLALSATIEGLDVNLSRWDSLRILSFIEPTNSPMGTPSIFAMLNVMKADYLAARYVAFQALSQSPPESGLYSDTLDYARYGMAPSMLTLAQRSCYDVLDKIAVATTEYFNLTEGKREISFSNRWFAKAKAGTPLEWHPSLAAFFDCGNHGLIALAELSLDTGGEGGLRPKKLFRDASTHRFTVLHDVNCTPSRFSPYIEHGDMDQFVEHLLETLHVTRSALLYFTEMIAIEEAIKERKPGLRAELFIPNHHDIRGDADEVLVAPE